MAFEDIGKQVGMNMDAYRGNPGALEQQVNKPMGIAGAAQKKSGLQAPLIKLLALQQLKQEQKTQEDKIKLQMMQQGEAPSVKEQVETDAIQRSVDETTKGIMGALNQQAAAKKKAQNKLLANATRFQQPTNPMARGNPMQMAGIAGNRRNNMRNMAQGGIVGFRHGGPHNPREIAMQKLKEKIKAGREILNPNNIAPFARRENQSKNYIAPGTLSSSGNPIKRLGKLNENTNIDIQSLNPIDRSAAALANVTAPNLNIETETNSVNPPTLDTSTTTPKFTTKVGPNLNYMGRPGMPTDDSKGKPTDDSGKPVIMPKSPTEVGPSMTSTPGGLQGLFDKRLQDAMADQYKGHKWGRPGGVQDWLRGLATGELTGAGDSMRVAEEQAYNRALKRASAGMDYAVADAKIAAQVLAAKISAAARAASTNQLKKSDALRAYLELNKELNTLDTNLQYSLGEKIKRLEEESQNPEQLRQDILTLKNGATGGRYSEIIEKMQIFLAQTGLPANSIPTDINPSLFDPNQQDKTVTQKTP